MPKICVFPGDGIGPEVVAEALAVLRTVEEVRGKRTFETGEALLLPSAGRVGAARVFFFGLPPLPLDAAAFSAFARTACGAMAKAGSRSFAVALPPFDGPAVRLWLEASLERPVSRQVLLGDARALHRDLSAARDALRARVEIAPVS